jgi:hypothetical protein
MSRENRMEKVRTHMSKIEKRNILSRVSLGSIAPDAITESSR